MNLYVKKFSAWTSEDLPKLPYVSMLFRRRLSAITKMVVETVHAVSENLEPVHVTFASEFGEIVRQHKISEGILETSEVMPAQFSLSVFNAPVSAASIVEKNMQGYSAIFGGIYSFENGLKEACAPLISGRETERMFVFADERIPEDYQKIAPYPNPICALALRISTQKENSICELDFSKLPEFSTAAEQALYFLNHRLPK
ncbi:MAG: beta-ketoacyl synthase chain length factor [Hallerella porci]|uniref:Beta-ketoacyl synthase-like protein n=1 Tax=Hallerella porci TaxID=1945871 RepID=A0ABX5LMZ3_9BACT|nr:MULTISPECIES: beta-ketoacyl synthase chain length factor [Hallerella]MCI5601493.1 beta-ketoacyl synthase chain length factor [Hallerella sp.]MDY3922470.1 beta-ketoacyl synthase chain length factor [Hallerella porci]PWL03672.1 beta-ketoacyl synthase-like protein [Hallerella porci]